MNPTQPTKETQERAKGTASNLTYPNEPNEGEINIILTAEREAVEPLRRERDALLTERESAPYFQAWREARDARDSLRQQLAEAEKNATGWERQWDKMVKESAYYNLQAIALRAENDRLRAAMHEARHNSEPFGVIYKVLDSALQPIPQPSSDAHNRKENQPCENEPDSPSKTTAGAPPADIGHSTESSASTATTVVRPSSSTSEVPSSTGATRFALFTCPNCDRSKTLPTGRIQICNKCMALMRESGPAEFEPPAPQGAEHAPMTYETFVLMKKAVEAQCEATASAIAERDALRVRCEQNEKAERHAG